MIIGAHIVMTCAMNNFMRPALRRAKATVKPTAIELARVQSAGSSVVAASTKFWQPMPAENIVHQ